MKDIVDINPEALLSMLNIFCMCCCFCRPVVTGNRFGGQRGGGTRALLSMRQVLWTEGWRYEGKLRYEPGFSEFLKGISRSRI